MTGPDGTGCIYRIEVAGGEGARIYYFSHDEWFKSSILGRLQVDERVYGVSLSYCLIPIRAGLRYLAARFDQRPVSRAIVIAGVGETITAVCDITDCLPQYPECKLRPR